VAYQERGQIFLKALNEPALHLEHSLLAYQTQVQVQIHYKNIFTIPCS
jgi:hypothetical protein